MAGIAQFGERLRAAMEAWHGNPNAISAFSRELANRGLTKRGASRGMIRQYLEGDAVPTIEFAEVAADVLGVRLEWLIRGKGHPGDFDTGSDLPAAIAREFSLGDRVREWVHDLLWDELNARDPEWGTQSGRQVEHLGNAAEAVVWASRQVDLLAERYPEGDIPEAEGKHSLYPIIRKVAGFLTAPDDILPQGHRDLAPEERVAFRAFALSALGVIEEAARRERQAQLLDYARRRRARHDNPGPAE